MKSKKKKKITNTISPEVLKKINLVASLLFFLSTCFILGFYKTDFFFRMQDFSLFLIDKNFFFNSFQGEPGGFIQYVGNFFTQFCYYPWLGIALFIASLFLLQWLVYKVFNIQKKGYILSFIPSAMLLLFITQMDYAIYEIKSQGIIFSQLTGLIITIGLFSLYKLCKTDLIRILYIIIVIAAGYPLLGFYSLLTALLIGLHEVFTSKSWKTIIILLLLIVGIPLIFYYFLYKINIKYIYFAGLPYMDFLQHTHLWYPLIVIFIALLIFPFKSYKKADKKEDLNASRHFVYVNLGLFIITLCAVFIFTYKESNFHNQLKMERAVDQGNWNAVLKIAAKVKNPNRPIVMYRNIALLHTGQLGSALFSYPEEDALNPNTKLNWTFICGPRVLFHFGLWNSSYHWAMETMVIKDLKIEYLKSMAKTALFNNEPELARKYLRTLEKTLFHKGWAKHYKHLLDNPELLKPDAEYKLISSMQNFTDLPWEYGEENALESYIIKHCARLSSGGSNEVIELALVSSMQLKDNIPLFWSRLITYKNRNEGKALPIHIQEAALLFYELEGNEKTRQSMFPYVKPDDNSPVLQRFQHFTQMVNMFGTTVNEATVSRFKQSFGDTYWFYYYFVMLK